MNLLIIILGTMGDVLPMVNIVKYLKKYKFKATIMTHEDHKNLVKKNNINFISFNTNYEYEKNNIFKFKEFKDTSSNFLSLLSDYQHPFTNLSYLVKSKIMSAPTLKNISNNIAYHFINIVDNFDMVIASNTLDIVPSLTEKYKIPLINIMHFPWFYETTCFPHPLVCCRDSLNFPFNHISNLNSWKYMNKLLWLGYSQKDNRKKLGLEPIKKLGKIIYKKEKILNRNDLIDIIQIKFKTSRPPATTTNMSLVTLIEDII